MDKVFFRKDRCQEHIDLGANRRVCQSSVPHQDLEPQRPNPPPSSYLNAWFGTRWVSFRPVWWHVIFDQKQTVLNCHNPGAWNEGKEANLGSNKLGQAPF